MKSYIIRIYGDENDGQLMGTVERPGQKVKLAFTSFDELRDIIQPRKILAGRGARPSKKPEDKAEVIEPEIKHGPGTKAKKRRERKYQRGRN